MSEDSAPQPAAELAAEEAAEAGLPRGAGYTVALPNFEGPLDLLLHLIQQHELDVMDIPIGFITEKYLDYVVLMQELNIDVASEYLVMAATLAHIKSRMLLPTPPDEEPDADEPEFDPRAELVRRLLEYQKYKQAGAQLADRSVFGRDVFARGIPAPEVEGTAPLAPVSLFKLLDAFSAVLSRAKTVVDHEVELERFSITDRINELADLLRAHRRIAFERLFDGATTRSSLILTFLALLEMTRLRMTRLYQTAPLEPITVELAVTDDDDSDVGDPVARSESPALEQQPSPAADQDSSDSESD